MTERERQLVAEIYEVREKLQRTQHKLKAARARLRLWPLRQQALRRERRALEEKIARLQKTTNGGDGGR